MFRVIKTFFLKRLLLSPVHTKNDNYKDKDISVHSTPADDIVCLF